MDLSEAFDFPFTELRGNAGMQKQNEAMMGTFTGTGLTFDSLPVCFIVRRTHAGALGPCLFSEDL